MTHSPVQAGDLLARLHPTLENSSENLALLPTGAVAVAVGRDLEDREDELVIQKGGDGLFMSPVWQTRCTPELVAQAADLDGWHRWLLLFPIGAVVAPPRPHLRLV